MKSNKVIFITAITSTFIQTDTENRRYNVRRYSWGAVIYIIIGVIVASNRGYLANLSSISGIVSALLAIFLWPLLLIGVSLHISA